MVRLAPVWMLLVVALAATLGALEWRRLARRHARLRLDDVLRRAPHLYATLPLAAALLGVQALLGIDPDLAAWVPVWLEYRYTAILWGSVAALFAGLGGLVTAGALATRHPRRAGLLVGSVLLVCAVEVIQRQYTRVPDLGERVVDGVVLQTSGVSCAAASAANLLRQHGLSTSEREMAALLGTTSLGTSGAQIIHGLGRAGFSCARVDAAAGDPAAPAILFVDAPGAGREAHAVLATRLDAAGATLLDPLAGRVDVSRRTLGTFWHGNGVRCLPPARRLH